MNAIKKYFERRIKAIIILLEKPSHVYNAETFHQLRIEIKKLDTLLEMLTYCTKNNKIKKESAIIKKIFSMAGKIREIEIEEAILKRYFPDNLPVTYMQNLQEQKLSESENYFSFVTKKLIHKIKKSFVLINQALHCLNKKNTNRYINRKKDTVNKIIQSQQIPASAIHKLRKHLKKLHFSGKILHVKKPEMKVFKHNNFAGLLGDWHDLEVMQLHVDSYIKTNKITSKDRKQLEDIRARLSTECNNLYVKINASLPY